jgi:hypothetical protein
LWPQRLEEERCRRAQLLPHKQAKYRSSTSLSKCPTPRICFTPTRELLPHFPYFFRFFCQALFNHMFCQFPNQATITRISCNLFHISLSSSPICTNLVSLESPHQDESNGIGIDGFGPAVVVNANFLYFHININISLILAFFLFVPCGSVPILKPSDHSDINALFFSHIACIFCM